MRNIVFYFFILFPILSFSQIAIINDSDGFTNVRKEPNKSSEIITVIHENIAFLFENSTENWIKVYIPKNKYHIYCDWNNFTVGYIHKSRLMPLNEGINIIEESSIKFEYVITPFSSTNKHIDSSNNYISHINGRLIYGTDGIQPKNEIAAINISINGVKIDVSEALFEDLYNCNSNNVMIQKTKNTYYISNWNSDGAGGYLIVWVIQNYKLTQRLIFTP